MCSFICTTKEFTNLSNKKSSLRGPDHSQISKIGQFNIIHNLLDISQHKIIQPCIEEDIILLYNGEIYDPHSSRDTDLIIPLYKKYGTNFIEHINGEYSIVIIDKRTILLYADVFATKPLFYSVENNHIGIASYASELQLLGFNNIIRVGSSTLVSIDLDSGEIITSNHSAFSLREFKTTYDDCIQSFINACKLRCNKKAAVCLSSGHDSGSVLQCSLDNNLDNTFYYVDTGREDRDVIKKRFNLCEKYSKEYKKINYIKNRHIYDAYEIASIRDKMEEYEYYKEEPSTLMLSKMLRTIKRDGFNIVISGQGGDEIISNYIEDGCFFTDLELQFPWDNFFNGENRLLIDQFEYIGGVYGLEVRYPFLDKVFVQEFLNLTKELKNKFYKSVITEYLNKAKMPTKAVKVGMSME
jgi:asparagine synthase (glutamine-hydrolysing)